MNVAAAPLVAILTGQKQAIIPVGQCAVLQFNPIYPPMAPPADGYDVIHDDAWLVSGNVTGGTIDIAVINDSNYQAFVNGGQPILPVQQMPNANGPFNLTVTFPKDNHGEAFAWWMVFDNRAGASNVTVYIDNDGNTFSTSFVWTGLHPSSFLWGRCPWLRGCS